MKFHIITLFPGAFDSYIGESIIKRAIEDKKVSVAFYNPRDFSGHDNPFKHIDKPPYAGGPGMVIQAEPVIGAIEAAVKDIGKSAKKPGKPILIWLTPSGRQFDTAYAKKIVGKVAGKNGEKNKNKTAAASTSSAGASTNQHIIIVCGRYEGIDARVKKMIKAVGDAGNRCKLEEVSVGPFVVTGGELPAMLIMDCVSRQVEGVLGNFDSREEERVASHDVYTRPEVIEYKGKKYRVPKVLLSGDHKKIEEWRRGN